jgi:hypothetical protein
VPLILIIIKMKKMFVYGLSVVFLAGSLVSCGKTTKGKLSNDWTVESMTQKMSYKSNYNSDYYISNNQSTDDVSVDGSSYTVNWSYSDQSSYYDWWTEEWTDYSDSENGSGKATVDVFDFKINKDGTWEKKMGISISEDGYKIELIEDQSGTWSFVGKSKNEDFKKNERVMFNVLDEKTTYKETYAGDVYSDSETATYMTGENTMVYKVIESKKKSLELSMEGKTETKFENGSSTSTNSTIMKMVAK